MKKYFFMCLCLQIIFTSSAVASFGRPNVALGGSIISSSPAVLGSAEYINDGLVSTMLYSYQQSGGLYYCRFVLDLSKLYSIDKIDLFIAQTRGFTIHVSTDNENWTLAETREWAGTSGTAISIPFAVPITGRYIKYYGWANWNQYVGVNEIAVYENGSVPVSSPAGSLGTNNIAAMKQIAHVLGTSETNSPPAHCLDSDVGTSWISTEYGDDDQTGKNTYTGGIVIDLGEEKTIGKIFLKTNAYHSIVISFPVDPVDFWGEKWLFRSTPDLFATDITGSGEVTFDIKGLVMSRYVAVYVQTFQVIDIKPDISEIEIYEWTENINNCTDSDGDGVSDLLDTCPGTPSGSPVYSNGCPSIKGDFNNNKKLDMGDVMGILKSLSSKADTQ